MNLMIGIQTLDLTAHHAKGHVQILLHPADEKVVGRLVVPVLSHLLFQRCQQGLQLLLAVQPRHLPCSKRKQSSPHVGALAVLMGVVVVAISIDEPCIT